MSDRSGGNAASGSPRLRVLVIDDDPLLLRLFERLFRELHATMVASAAEALALLKRGEVFDAILCDMQMRGMGGKEFFRALDVGRGAASSRVIFMSGGACSEEDALLLETHPSLRKPFSLKDFKAVFARLPAVAPASEREPAPPESRSLRGA
jgi:two-component system, NtrC family, sensor kinase